MADYVLLGNTNSYFTLKVRGYLRWRGIDFIEVPPDVEMYKTYLSRRVQAKQIPVLVDRVRRQVVIDTSNIIDHVEKVHTTVGAGARADRIASALPEGPCQRAVCYWLETFCDQWMLFPGMHYRWSFPEQRGVLRNDWGELLHPYLPAGARDAKVAPSMALFSGLLPSLGINDVSIPGVERTFHRLCKALAAHLAHHDFLLGPKPTLADFAFAGPFAGHLCRDPVPAKEIRINYPTIATWMERVQTITPPKAARGWRVTPDGCLDPPVYPDAHTTAQAAAFANDAIPATLRDIVAVFFDEHVPILVRTHAALRAYFAKHPAVRDGGRPIPRIIGFHEVEVGGIATKRAVYPFELWKLARGKPRPGDAAAVEAFAGGFRNGAALVALVDDLPQLYLYHAVKLFTRERDPAKL